MDAVIIGFAVEAHLLAIGAIAWATRITIRVHDIGAAVERLENGTGK